MSRIFIVDSRDIVRLGLRRLIEAEPDLVVVGEAADPTRAMAALEASDADTVIVDAGTDDAGVRLCRSLASGVRPFRILMCARRGRTAPGTLMLAGADEVFTLRDSTGSILDRLRRTEVVGPVLEPDVTAALFDRVRAGAGPFDPITTLTERELEILGYLSEGLTNREIAEHLHLSPKTVKNKVSTILKKLGMHTRTEAAVFAARRDQLVG